MPSSLRPAIALIGAGPRGASLLERIGAHLDASPRPLPLDIYVIDDAPDGAGKIWRTDQPRELCMNTLADAVTLFTEHASTVAGPIVEGPTLFEWCVLALHTHAPTEATADRVATFSRSHVDVFNASAIREQLAADYLEELTSLLPESHPSRALYGEYLAWCYDRAVSLLPTGVAVHRRRSRAVDIERSGDRELVTLADGGRVEADSVILATGWMPRTQTASEQQISGALSERPELVWVRPDSPVDQDLSRIAPGAHAIVRGLGMGFFDTMALLTVDRGGRFIDDPNTPSGLRYVPSGHEPVLFATSNRGVPFRAKTLYHSLPPRPEQRFLRGVNWSQHPRPIDFNREFWPRIVADAFYDHAHTLYRVRPEAFVGELPPVLEAIGEALDTVLSNDADQPTLLEDAVIAVGDAVAPFLNDPADRFDLLTELAPANREFASLDEYNEWVTERTLHDLREAELGHDSALKAGLWSVSASRGFASRVGTGGGFDAESRLTGFATAFAIGGLAGSGPPAFRNRQLLALVDAGLVRFIGPRATVQVDETGFTAESASVPGSRVTTHVLIDAWMHSHDLAATADPLAQKLLSTGRARTFTVASRSGSPLATGAFNIDAATGRLIGADGALDSAVHVAGIPVDAQLHDTVISPMPGADPTMLRETDRVAASALRVAADSPAASAAGTPAAAAQTSQPEFERALNA